MKYFFTVVDLQMATSRQFIDSIKVPFVAISISSPETEDYELPKNSNCKEILYLKFHDITEDGTIRSINDVGEEIVPINQKHVNQILDFVEKHKGVKDWLINCEAGMSRSPAVALALSEIMNKSDNLNPSFVRCLYPKIFNNILVKQSILKGYEKRKKYNTNNF